MRRREISPGFWKDERVWKLTHEAKLLYLGMTQVADREGRLLDKPFEIGVEVWPWAPGDAAKLIEEMVSVGLVARYRVGSTACLAFPTAAWKRHQRPHPKEQSSRLPRNPSETEAAEGDPQGAPRFDLGHTQVEPRLDPGTTQVLPSRKKVVASRAGSSGSSEPSGSLRTSQDHQDLSGPSGPSDPANPVQARLDGGEDPAGRKVSHWVRLWEEKLSVSRLMRIAENELTTVDDPLFDVQEHDLDVKPQTLNSVLKKVSEDLARRFAPPDKPWTLNERLEAVEQAWEAYLTSHFGAGVDPPYALNAFASPKTSIPSYQRAKEQQS